MSANCSQEKLELLIRIADSRLGIINETEEISRNVKRQTKRVKTLKNRILTVPIIASASGIIGSIMVVGLLNGRSRKKAEAATKKQHPASTNVTGLIVKVLMTLLLPTAKTFLVNFAKSQSRRFLTK